MTRNTRSFALGLFATGIVLGGCGQEATEAAPDGEPVTVEEIDDTDIHRITLSDSAAERLGIEVATVLGDGTDLLIPYSALLYDAAGATWTFTNPEELVFVREAIEVENIEDEVVRLSAGPDEGTSIVSVGVAELWGAEIGVGGGH